MSIELELVTRIENETGFVIHPIAPKDDASPYFYMRRINTDPETNAEGENTHDEIRFEIVTFDKTYNKVIQSTEALKASISGHSNTQYYILLSGENDIPELFEKGKNQTRYARAIQIKILSIN